MPYFQSVVDPAQAVVDYQYSRDLLPGCWNTAAQDLPCSLSRPSNGEIQVFNLEQVNDLLMNETSAMTNLYFDPISKNVYLGPPPIQDTSAASDGGTPQYPRFEASTFAAFTVCRTTDCNLTINADETSYSFACPGGFSRNATTEWFEAGPYIQTTGNYTGYTELQGKYESAVGLQWGVFAHLEDVVDLDGNTNYSVSTVKDHTAGKPSTTFVMQCNSTIGQTDYFWANGSLANGLSPNNANQTLFNILLGPFLSQGPVINFPKLETFRTRLNLTSANNTITQVTTKFEELMGGIALSFLGANIITAPATMLQLPQSTILTQVPKLPLFTLVVLNLWYAVLAICLCILACVLLSRGENGQDIIAVRKLLSVSGLTQAAVSNHRSIHGEDVCIGVIRRDGEWHFNVWPANVGKGEAERLLPKEKKAADTGASSTLGDADSTAQTSGQQSIEITMVEAEPMLRDYNDRRDDDQPVSPISQMSYSGDFLTSDLEERRRVSRSLEWADDE